MIATLDLENNGNTSLALQLPLKNVFAEVQIKIPSRSQASTVVYSSSFPKHLSGKAIFASNIDSCV